jgi:hypothetical protein
MGKKMIHNKILGLLSVLVCACMLSGCASPALQEAMVAHAIPEVRQHNKTISIKTQGGAEIDGLGRSDISNNDFAKAIEKSIIENELFTQVIHSTGSDYVLNVAIVSMNKPVFGGDFTVDMESAWTLSDPVTPKNIMRKSIKSSHTATMGEAFGGAKRLRLAVEGAARKNIQQGLMAISELHLE